MREPGDSSPDGLLQPHTLPICAGSLHLLQGLLALLQHLHKQAWLTPALIHHTRLPLESGI